MELTPIQKQAVEILERNILVSAGAGAGKTRVLVERFIHFVVSGKARVDEILTLTFTDKAANEMKSRIMQRFRELGMLQARRDLESAYISTLHAFAMRLLKEHSLEACLPAGQAGVPPDFLVMETEESDFLQDQALDQVIEEQCAPGSGLFELLKVYGENGLRSGIKKIYAKAMTDGLNLKDFFSTESDRHLGACHSTDRGAIITSRIEKLLQELGEKEWVDGWKQISKNPKPDWVLIEEVRSWSSGFKRLGNKMTKPLWKETAQLCEEWTRLLIDELAAVWCGHFEPAAIAFEKAYQSKKFEKNVLDFDDLQLHTLRMLQSDHPGCRKIREHYRQLFKHILVDEYQDINPLQAALIECFAGGQSLFLVGDCKQSIYGFRGASPLYFMEREKLYLKGKAGSLIPMMENFRTQKGILDFINPFFQKLWAEDGFLHAVLEPKTSEPPGPRPELILVEKKEDENLEQGRMREAAVLAKKIRQLHEQENIPYGDMAILFQALTHVGIYEHALKKAGIPYFVVAGRGFYHQPEIRDVMSLLSVLENPLLDIPLAAVLRSPFFRVTDDALFWLSHTAKLKDSEAPLFNGVAKAEVIAEISDAEKIKIRSFRDFLHDFILLKNRLTLAELLELIFQKTSYESSVLADPQGVRRYANLRKLVNLAREHESHDRMSLTDFVNLVHSQESRDVRESEAQVEAESSGKVLRIITIHSAKGLEFPVCFVADLAHGGENPESRVFLAESGLGCSFQIMNPLTRAMEKPAAYTHLAQAMEQRETQEWKRLFYVACTRAKSRLILSGVYQPPKEAKTSFNEMKNWMHWVMAEAENLPLEIIRISDFAGHSEPSIDSVADDKFQKMAGLSAEEMKSDRLFPDALQRAALAAQAGTIHERLEAHSIPAARALDLPVSAFCAYAKDPLLYWRTYEIGRRERLPLEEFKEEQIKDEESISAADFGTRMHQFLEVLSFKEPSSRDKIFEKIFSDLEKSQQEEARSIIDAFIKSSVFQSLSRAKKIYREIPFVLNERHGRIDGVIDVLFQDEKGNWNILDYKTAIGDESKVKESAYDLQIMIYAAAVRQILGVTPGSGILYFLKNSWRYEIPVSEKRLQEKMELTRTLQENILSYRTKRMMAAAFSR